MVINFRGSRSQNKRAHKLVRKVKILANGKEVRDVFYYDGRRRMYGTNLRNEQGQFFLNPDGEVATMYFKVRSLRLVRI